MEFCEKGGKGLYGKYSSIIYVFNDNWIYCSCCIFCNKKAIKDALKEYHNENNK